MTYTAKRLEHVTEYYFSQKLREIDSLNKAGKQIINLGIGSPDLPPHPDVIKVLQEESARANVHGYQNYKGVPALRNAFAHWYKKWYGVTLDAETEVLPLAGSKEGIMHICMSYLNQGDRVLIPNPGYPTYSSAVALAGGICVNYNLTESNDYCPDLEALELEAAKGGIKLMWLNYPHMPSGRAASIDVFIKLIAFARKHRILICHDNPYSFILNEKVFSLLSIEGAKDVVLELNSLSKSHNMAGWRVGVLCAAKERISEVLQFKSNMDSGMFLPLQLAAAKALSLDKDWYDYINSVYAQRREKVYAIMDLLECTYNKQQTGLFVWALIPKSAEDGYALCDQLLYNANVFITPGGIFGSNGNQYIRISLCGSLERFDEALERIAAVKTSFSIYSKIIATTENNAYDK